MTLTSRLKLFAATLLLVLGVSSNISAQGPFSAQIQAALRAFLTQVHTWTATQTFTDITVNGTCTGCAVAGVSSATGTANQVVVSAATGAVTFSTPQDIATTSSPLFAASTFGSLSSPYGSSSLTSPQTEASNSFALGITMQPPKASAPTATGAGSCTTGTHVAALTAVTTEGVESLPSAVTGTATCNGTTAFRVNVGTPQVGVATINMYLSKAGTSSPLFLCLSGQSNTSTQLSCTLADGSLTTAPPSTQPTRTVVARWQQSDETSGSPTVGPTGLQLWPSETAASNDFTFATRSAIPNVLSLSNTTNGTLRNFQAGALYVGSNLTNQGDKAHITSSELAVGTTTQHLWCSNVTNSTCDTGITRNAAAVVEANTGVAGTLGSFKGGFIATNRVISTTAPTIASGGCTSPAVTSNNGTAAFLLTVGTSCTGVKTIVLTMPAATNFWACDANNNTSDAQQAANTIASRATSTTAVTLTNYARTTGLQTDYTASDTILVKCSGE